MSYGCEVIVLDSYYTLPLVSTRRCLQTWSGYIHSPCCSSKALFNTDASKQYLDNSKHSGRIVPSDAMSCISHVYEANAPLENPLAHLSAPTSTLDLREAAPRPSFVTGVDARRRNLQGIGRVLAEALGPAPSYVLHGEQGTVGGDEHVKLPVGDNAYAWGAVKDSWHYKGVLADRDH